MRMIDLGSQTLQIMDTATGVECGHGLGVRQLRRTSLRSLVECMVPACCGFPQQSTSDHRDDDQQSEAWPSPSSSPRVVTGTFFGRRKGGRVSFCVQEDTRSGPLLVLELAVPTAFLAREMQSGVLRIALALECERRQQQQCCDLLREPVWALFCNGRRVGFAITRRGLSVSDAAVLNRMQSVSVGAGVLPDEDVLYMRAAFDRVVGSSDSQSFHMKNPLGSSSAQHLSVFLLRST